MLLDVVRWTPAYMGDLRAQRLPIVIQPPHEGCDPGKSALNTDNAEIWKPLEYPFKDEAGDLACKCQTPSWKHLDVIGDESYRGHTPDARLSNDVHADRNSVASRGLPDWLK